MASSSTGMELSISWIMRSTTATLALFVEQAAGPGWSSPICYEDQTIPRLVKAGRLDAGKRVEHARREIGWLRENWFARPSYLKINGQPVLLSFGQDGLSDAEWAGSRWPAGRSSSFT